MSLTQYSQKQIPALLASKTIDASKGVLFGNTASMDPNTVNRTILIGLGGTGVQTIDYVKGAVTAKIKPTWMQYVAFLGIDTDWNEFDHAKFLTDGEKEMITGNNVSKRGGTPAARSIAQKRLVPDEKNLVGLNGPGASRKRVVGSFKLNDQEPGMRGTDQIIVDHIQRIASQTLCTFNPGDPGSYEVYVIGSVCGGTCSGAFLQMPALIQKALNGRRVHTRAILYLPDTLASLDPTFSNELYANGYASLKELDYYMGESMREGYCDTWGYNNASSSEISLPNASDPSFFSMPYLVGSQNPGSIEASVKAKETIAEHLVSLLGKMVPAASNNSNVFSVESHFDNAKQHVSTRLYKDPVAKTQEADGENHDRPRHYAAIGFAEASAPQKIVRAYTVGKTCMAAGLKPISPADRATLISHGESANLLPFRSEDDLLSSIEGTKMAQSVIQPVATILSDIHSGAFNFVADLHLNEQDVTWRNIRNHEFDGADTVNNSNSVFLSRTSIAVMDTIRSKIRAAFQAYLGNVINYVKKDGPLAFSNLYHGRFVPNGDDFGVGIEAMLKNLSIGKTPNGKDYAGWTPVADAQKKLIDARNSINNTTSSLFNINVRNRQQAVWIQAYEGWMKSRINEKLREFALGTTGAFTEVFLNPAQLLADEVKAFGYALEGITDIYQGFGNKMESFSNFQQARDNLTEVNLAAVNDSAYKWIKSQADARIATIDAKKFRDNLIDHFFANRSKWVEIPENRIEINNLTNTVKLIHEDVPIPARTLFDEFAAKELPPMLNVSIQALFDQLNANGSDYQRTATDLVTSLSGQSGLQFNGDVSASRVVAVYPDALNTVGGTGSAIASAIEQAFRQKFQGKELQVFASADSDSIRCYQLAAPFEIYHLHDLASWEREYEAELKAAKPQSEHVSHGVEALLHCMSPAAEGTMGQTYQDVMPWEEYPSIVLHNVDPRQPDPQSGEISREGQFRIALDKIIERAEKVGVLYCQQTSGGYLVYRVNCDKTIVWNKFNILSCPTDKETGLIPMRRGLAEAVAEQHGKTLAEISKPVVLRESGVFSGAAQSSELAWKNAARVLRAHVPMYREVLRTLELFEKWGKTIAEYNLVITERLRPAKMVWLMKALLIQKREDNAWILKTENGNDKVLVNLAPAMMSFMQGKEKRFIENGLFSFFLYNRLNGALPGEALNDRYLAARKKYFEYQNDMAIEELNKGKAYSDDVSAERSALLEKGMLDEETDTIREKFRKEMREFGLTDEELVRIQKFYYRTNLAETLDYYPGKQ